MSGARISPRLDVLYNDMHLISDLYINDSEDDRPTKL